jgi:undecaprenyl-diphosphatase
MLGATVYDLYKNRGSLAEHDMLIIAIGFVAAFLFALPIVHGLVRFVGRHGFGPFAWYRIVLGLVALAALSALA